MDPDPSVVVALGLVTNEDLLSERCWAVLTGS